MKFIKGLFSRWVIISLLIIIQTALFCLIIFIFASDYIYVSIAVEILSLIVLASFIASPKNPDHKISWIVIILMFPPAGFIIYLIYGRKFI